MAEVGPAFTYTYGLVDNIASYADMYSYYIFYFGEMFCQSTSDCLGSYSPLHNKLHFRIQFGLFLGFLNYLVTY